MIMPIAVPQEPLQTQTAYLVPKIVLIKYPFLTFLSQASLRKLSPIENDLSDSFLSSFKGRTKLLPKKHRRDVAHSSPWMLRTVRLNSLLKVPGEELLRPWVLKGSKKKLLIYHEDSNNVQCFFPGHQMLGKELGITNYGPQATKFCNQFY